MGLISHMFDVLMGNDDDSNDYQKQADIQADEDRKEQQDEKDEE